MRRALARLAAAALALAVLPLHAADVPAHYAYRQQLTVSGREAVVQYRLPRNVYLHALTAELHDLRVFDVDGTPLPFALRTPLGTARASRQGAAVRVFPVFSELDDDGIDTGVEIRRARDGTVISVEARSAGKSAAAPALSALVLDMGGSSRSGTFDALQFALPPGTAQYEAHLAIEASDDLKQWHGVAESHVSWMVSSDGQVLASDRIAFEPQRFRYARIRWLAGKPLKFAGIHAQSVRYDDMPAPIETMVVQPLPGRDGADLMYPSAIAIPVQRIGVQFAERNISLPAKLGNYRELPSLRGGKRTSWQFEPVASATFYRFGQGGRERMSGDVSIMPSHSTHWVLRPLTASGSKPALRLGWSPATLVFLANGHAPYTLAYGRRDATPAAWSLAQVAPGLSEAELGKLEHATAAAERAVARPAMPSPGAAVQASASAATHKGILWGTLALGLCVLAAMAWQLVRQMK